jgi:phenylacetate-CoA ligase
MTRAVLLARPEQRGPGWLRSWSELRHLQRTASATFDEIQHIQLARLRWVVDYATHRVALYQDLYPANAADHLDQPEDLSSLPFTVKSDHLARPQADRCSGPPPTRTRRVASSGSSGEPIEVLYPPRAAWYQGLLRLRMEWMWGLRLWQRRVAIADPDPRARPLLTPLVNRFLRTLPRHRQQALLVQEVRKARPHLLVGQSHQLLELGEQLAGAIRPRLVVTHGEGIDPRMRERLALLYGCRTVDHYGTAEHGSVAWQCLAADLYHINHEAVMAEVLDEEGRPVPPGGSGELVLTGLWNPLMPFLRYRTGDIVTLAQRPCACGCHLPALETITGRSSDWIRDSDGSWIAPQRLWLGHTPTLDWEWLQRFVCRYRVHQNRTGAIRVEVVAREPLPEDFAERVRRSYDGVLKDAWLVEVRLVDELPLPPSGRFRTISSDIRRVDWPLSV